MVASRQRLDGTTVDAGASSTTLTFMGVCGEDDYRYGFNGKEKDNEIKGSGNSLDFGARVYDSRLSRFLSIDPLSSSFPYQSPYVFAGNSPIAYVDKNGEKQFHYLLTINSDGSTTLKLTKTYNNWFRAMDYHHIKVEGTNLSYTFTPWGTATDPTSNELIRNGGSNYITDVYEFAKNPMQAMLSGKYRTDQQILKETAQELALALLIGRLIKSGFKGSMPRLPQDVALGQNKKAPAALPTAGRKIGKSTAQNNAVQDRVAAVKELGATDIRIDQQQVDVNGNHVGVNRPDLQYTLNGERHYVEWDTPDSGRGAGHEARIKANDPKAKVELNILK
jgi:RHS repeat-associated protein